MKKYHNNKSTSGGNKGGYGSRLYLFAPNPQRDYKFNKFKYEHSYKRNNNN